MGRASNRKKRQGQEGSSDSATYGYFLVAFLDLVGQTSELRRFSSFPHTPEHLDDAISVWRRTAGRVRPVRNAFESFLKTARQPYEMNSQIPAPYQQRFQALGKPKLTLRGFSDCFVITTPLFGEGDDPVRAIRDVFSIVYGITGMSLVSMAQGKPIRGGIDVERGIEIYAKEYYGPGLLSAYE